MEYGCHKLTVCISFFKIQRLLNIFFFNLSAILLKIGIVYYHVGIVSALFPDKLEDAFASLRVLQGLGATLLFCYSNSLCVLEKMYILAAVCIVGTALYIGVEITEKKKMTKNEKTDTP